ncbi:hypothetical protein HPB51_003765 [Rhipicephalus microplus]|uniref:Uncharacterized protein n=1 Tax=Rhipicephalus microplus TaxID=6941 RepID=A0A9J6DZ97_RHIMP|nr:hypothetical protein HPB51_003765 [Rhipicephalus microplus]
MIIKSGNHKRSPPRLPRRSGPEEQCRDRRSQRRMVAALRSGRERRCRRRVAAVMAEESVAHRIVPDFNAPPKHPLRTERCVAHRHDSPVTRALLQPTRRTGSKTIAYQERLVLCKSGGELLKWKWFDKMSLLLGDRPMVQARDDGVDTAAKDEGIVLLCDGSEEEGDASDDLETYMPQCNVSPRCLFG